MKSERDGRGRPFFVPALFREKVFADRRKDVDQHHFFIHHRSAVKDVGRKVKNLTRPLATIVICS
jgi:hypothetical protein